VLAQLLRYTHRVAISNRRLVAADDGGVAFRWKDHRCEGASLRLLPPSPTGSRLQHRHESPIARRRPPSQRCDSDVINRIAQK
jgi:hypothetical protein